MSHTIELSIEAIKIAEREAKANGITLEAWVEREIKQSADVGRLRSTIEKRNAAWEDFIGAAARLPRPDSPRKRTRFGEILVEKYRKQGLKLRP